MAKTDTLRMPVKTTRLRFDEDGYPGFDCEAWVNAPMRWVEQLASVDEATPEAEARKLILRFFPAWNFHDLDGKVIPHSAKGFDDIPNDLVNAMLRHRMNAIREAAMPAPLGGSLSPENNGAQPDSPMTVRTEEPATTLAGLSDASRPLPTEPSSGGTS